MPSTIITATRLASHRELVEVELYRSGLLQRSGRQGDLRTARRPRHSALTSTLSLSLHHSSFDPDLLLDLHAPCKSHHSPPKSSTFAQLV
eukprot:15869262-Heterocapsa_arctica.AAC.1